MRKNCGEEHEKYVGLPIAEHASRLFLGFQRQDDPACASYVCWTRYDNIVHSTVDILLPNTRHVQQWWCYSRDVVYMYTCNLQIVCVSERVMPRRQLKGAQSLFVLTPKYVEFLVHALELVYTQKQKLVTITLLFTRAAR